MRYLIVGGDFSCHEKDVRRSGYITKLGDSLLAAGAKNVVLHNGGSLVELWGIAYDYWGDDFDAIIWAPNVDNNEGKIVDVIKKINPRVMLISTKENTGIRYSPLELVDRALKAKANLLLEFRRRDRAVLASLIDPLGNRFFVDEENVGKVAKYLHQRVKLLASVTRIGCTKISGDMTFPGEEHQAFVNLAKDTANKLTFFVDSKYLSRFLGNASFRCLASFPSLRIGNGIFVTRRNIDKETLTLTGFVPVEMDGIQVRYYGEHKPSVDTPIQRELYKAFPLINYIIHTHAYIKGAPMTKTVIPCGAMEEFDEIYQAVCDRQQKSSSRVTEFIVNLRGHGSIVAGCMVEDLRGHQLLPRSLYEDHRRAVK